MNVVTLATSYLSELADAHPTWAVVAGSAAGAFAANLANKMQLRRLVTQAVGLAVAPLSEALNRDVRRIESRVARLETKKGTV